MTPGRALLGFAVEARLEALPAPIRALARLAVLDWWAVTVGGAAEPVARLVRDAVIGEGAGEQRAGEADRVGTTRAACCSVLGTGLVAPPLVAALCNGTAAHALDYDDFFFAMPGHVTAPMVPGLLALAEARGRSGRDLLTGLAVGVEVAGRVAQALGRGHYRAGWHATATVGRLGGAMAAGHLLGLDAGRLDVALGLALAQGGGVQESFGTMAKPFQVGRAAADATLAALAAERGMTAPTGLLDRPGWTARWGGAWEAEALADGLGQRWALGGIVFKRYPCCFGAHAAVRALLALTPRPAPGAIDRVELTVSPTTLQVADQREPATGLAAKFSTIYCAAVALLRGRLGMDDFTDRAIGDPAVRTLFAQVRLTEDPALDERRARAVVRLRDGSVRSAEADLGAEADVDALGRDLGVKFRELVAPRLGRAAAESLLAVLGRLDDVDDVRGLAR